MRNSGYKLIYRINETEYDKKNIFESWDLNIRWHVVEPVYCNSHKIFI